MLGGTVNRLFELVVQVIECTRFAYSNEGLMLYQNLFFPPKTNDRIEEQEERKVQETIDQNQVMSSNCIITNKVDKPRVISLS